MSEVLFDEKSYARGIRLRIADQEIDVPARMVVDATGRHTLLGKQLRVKKNDPIFDQFAVHDVTVGTGIGIVPKIRSTLGVDEGVTPESRRHSEGERDDDREQQRQSVLRSERTV